MKNILIIVKKEIKDNVRDKRAFFFSLLYGPLFLPLIIGGSLIAGIKSSVINFDKTVNIAVVGQERAPNLMQYLRENNLEAIAAPDNYAEKIKEGDLDLVLEISSDYEERFRAGKPAVITLYVNQSDKDSTKAYRKVRTIVNGYDRKLGKLRMMARGLDGSVFDAINLIVEDLSTEGRKGQILGTMIPFVLIFAMFMGGFYLAIDNTAGERERHSLEPLLSLPVSRVQLVLGKFMTIYTFVFLSGLLSSISLYLVFNLAATEEISNIINVSALSISKAFLLILPLSFLITSLLMTVAAYTRSTKEAQTYLGFLMILPMAPFFLLQFMKLKTSLLTMAVPMLSQYQLLDKVMKDEVIATNYLLACVVGTLLMAALLLLTSIFLYKQDKILQ